ncbi:MAG: hypothetical protein AUI50_08755 [Crenarchaeota archaeon 13_1_40CM_2_52_14]|nr:MAG: hypothetical protein AUI97_06555 [Crenarchaeota archaeon 13_1_40CM_3_52_17]OLD33917.1 MAG: hypothetical protein AUI50_08755 [Crenarchaeota archaeon 13_1_40CM_2_52_14]OLE71869.1 MAG: hypothetical protein AUF78_00080 [archaeon 13_1_20CM_2_51_12]
MSTLKLVEKMYDAWLDGIRKLDKKEFIIGERLPGICQAAGLSDIKAEVQADGWLYSDPRRRLADVKQELRINILQFKTRYKTDRKYAIAGGMTNARINAYNRQTLAKMRALLSNTKKLRSDPTMYAASLFLVSGTKTV